MDYSDFLKSKALHHEPSGFTVGADDLSHALFDWQRVLTRWALAKGRAALFEDCGLGKTPQQLVWADHVCRHTGNDVLILAPLAVASQTQREGVKFGVDVTVCRDSSDVRPGINVTNYDRLHLFDSSRFSGVVLDESSILKNFAGKLRNRIIESFSETPYRLCCTATPSPNDYTELGNTAEFLGVMARAEMLAMFFINDTGKTGSWRLKGHVKDNTFWRWLSSWAVMMRRPSDIGFNNDGFDLPALKIIKHVIPFSGPSQTLFVEPASTLSERRHARKESMAERVGLTADMVNKSDEQWLCWCNLNDESSALKSSIYGAVEVKGADTPCHKESAMSDFQAGKIKCLVTKPSIAGFGMNWQNCARMAFVGLSDSYEQFYQAVRRCWRFGQNRGVEAHVVTGEREGAVVANIKRKERDMAAMFDGMITHMADLTKTELGSTERQSTPYAPTVEMRLPYFLEAA